MAADHVREALDNCAEDYWHGSVEDILESRGFVLGYVEAVSDLYGISRVEVLTDVMRRMEGEDDYEG